jgi:hypothetical protein
LSEIPKPEPRAPRPPRPIARRVRPPRATAPIRRKVRIRVRPKGGTWKADRDECDVLMARIVKVERDACEACGERRRLRFQWAHGFSRRYKGARWDFENSWCLCSACHLRFTHDPIGWDLFMRSRLPDGRYEALRARAQLVTRFEPMILVGLRHRSAELGVLTDEGWKAWQGARP